MSKEITEENCTVLNEHLIVLCMESDTQETSMAVGRTTVQMDHFPCILLF